MAWIPTHFYKLIHRTAVPQHQHNSYFPCLLQSHIAVVCVFGRHTCFSWRASGCFSCMETWAARMRRAIAADDILSTYSVPGLLVACLPDACRRPFMLPVAVVSWLKDRIRLLWLCIARCRCNGRISGYRALDFDDNLWRAWADVRFFNSARLRQEPTLLVQRRCSSPSTFAIESAGVEILVKSRTLCRRLLVNSPCALLACCCYSPVSLAGIMFLRMQKEELLLYEKYRYSKHLHEQRPVLPKNISFTGTLLGLAVRKSGWCLSLESVAEWLIVAMLPGRTAVRHHELWKAGRTLEASGGMRSGYSWHQLLDRNHTGALTGSGSRSVPAVLARLCRQNLQNECVVISSQYCWPLLTGCPSCWQSTHVMCDSL